MPSAPPATDGLRVAVIGAGVAGLSAARVLYDHGHRVVVYEKSRGFGGRAATRRIDQIGYDHGAQYFTADHPTFQQSLSVWQACGVVQRWRPRVGRVASGDIEASPDDRERYVAVPGMSGLGRHLAGGLDVQRQVRVAAPIHTGAGWQLHSDDGADLGRFDALLVAAPAPQASDLLHACAPHIAEQAASVEYAPAWAVMADAATDELLPYDALFFAPGALSWAARNSSKPERRGQTWVLHASPPWTHARLQNDAAEVGTELIEAFCTNVAIDPGLMVPRSSHRWLYALIEQPLEVGALWDAQLALAACGDWCQGGRIEGAFLSGRAAAGHLLRELVPNGSVEPGERQAET